MKGIILAAGLGIRLLPKTRLLPKCLLKISEETIIEYQVETLRKYGIDDITVVVGFQAEKIRKQLKMSVKYVYNPIYYKSNSSYSLWLARKELKNGWLHLNSDLVFHPQILKDFLNHPSQNALAVDTTIDPDDDGERVEIDKKGRVILMQKGMNLKFVYGRTIGMAKFDRFGASVILDYLDRVILSGEKNRWFFSVIGEYIKDIPIYTVSTNGNAWVDVDTNEEFERAKEIASKIEA